MGLIPKQVFAGFCRVCSFWGLINCVETRMFLLKSLCNFCTRCRGGYDVRAVSTLAYREIIFEAAHSSFETTHKLFLAIKNDYLDKARQANVGLGLKLVEWE